MLLEKMDAKLEKQIKEGNLIPLSINAPLKKEVWKEEYIGQSLKFEDFGVGESSLPTFRSYAENIPTEKKSGKMLAAAIIVYHHVQNAAATTQFSEMQIFGYYAKEMVDKYLRPSKVTSAISEEAQKLQNLSQASTLLIYYGYVKKCIADSEQAQRLLK